MNEYGTHRQREQEITEELNRLYDLFLAPFDLIIDMRNPWGSPETIKVLVVLCALEVRRRIEREMSQGDLAHTPTYDRVIRRVDSYRDELICFFDAKL